jgi:hypothetical protein
VRRQIGCRTRPVAVKTVKKEIFSGMKTTKLFLIILFLMPVYLSAQYAANERLMYPKLKLDLPLIDLPYQIKAMNTVGYGFFSSYANPSMSQSLAVTADMYSGFHFGMKYFYDNSNISEMGRYFIYFGAVILGDFILSYLPGGDGWLHEEYHRAVMSRYGINSFNDMNLFPIGAETVSVSNIKDQDLILLKKESPPDFVRLFAAGIEGEYVLINKLQRNNFFYEQKLPHELLYWLITLNSHLYIHSSSSSDDVDVETKKMNEKEKTISSRDFAGFDMTAWVYDLFRPDEPYEARGTHPSGTGINRYRTTRDLTGEELEYLQKQTALHIVNYLSPMLFGIRSFPLDDDGLTGNFTMRHLLTSFGSVVSAQVFLKYQPFNIAFAYHSYLNYEHYFPAIEAELVDYPFYLRKFGVFLSPRIIIGTQPENQKFKTGKHEFLGFFGLRVDFIAGDYLRPDFIIKKYFLPYIDFSVKTNGWVMGDVYLDSNVSVRIGISARF